MSRWRTRFDPRIRWVLAALLAHHALCAAAGGADEVPPPERLPSTGTVLSETSRDIGHGYHEVNRSQVNPPSSFEAVGHFAFVYYRRDKLCQCDRHEIAIAPDGGHAVFTDVSTGQLTLFRAASGARRALTGSFVGYPVGAIWKSNQVTVTLKTYENGASRTRKSTFPLQCAHVYGPEAEHEPVMGRQPRAHHHVYVVLLSDRVWNEPAFRKANPGHDIRKPCVYVGMTGLDPDLRFDKHMAGMQANRFVLKYGVRLLPDLYEVYNPMPYEAARDMEVELAIGLREAGYAVWQA